MSKTDENLAEAFAGESQANRRYLAFAKKADADGQPQVAKIFRAAAAAETIHAHSHFRVMGGVKTTADNLKAAVEGEHYEFTKMYPAFIKEAEAEGQKQAMVSFEYANQVESIHHSLFQKTLAAVEAGGQPADADVFVCSICGNTFEGAAPDVCPVCGTKRERFMKIE
jgi:rubrerythrin